MNRSVIIQSFVFCSIFSVALLISGCSKQAEEPAPQPRTLSVTVLQVNGSPSVDEFEAKMAEYATSDELLTITTETKPVSASSTNAELLSAIEGADLVVFPSLLNRQFREQSNAFHPIQANSALPDHLASVYAANEASQVWAAVLAIDPIVFVQKVGVSRTAGFTGAMTDWGQLRVLTTLERSRGNQEPFWAFMQSDNGLHDAWASYFLAFKYSSVPSRLYEQWLNTVQQAILDDAKSIQANGVDSEINTFPTVKNLADFVQSSSYFTSERYSKLVKLDETQRASVIISAFPTEGGEASVCYTVAAAVPLQAANPDDAQAWIDMATEDNDVWSAALYGTVVDATELKNTFNFPENCRFFIRENNASISQDEIKRVFDNNIENLNDVVEKIFTDIFPAQNGV